MANPGRLNMKEFITSKEKKQLYVNQMFSKIAPRYDLVTALLSYGQDRRWKKKLVQLTDVQPHHTHSGPGLRDWRYHFHAGENGHNRTSRWCRHHSRYD